MVRNSRNKGPKALVQVVVLVFPFLLFYWTNDSLSLTAQQYESSIDLVKSIVPILISMLLVFGASDNLYEESGWTIMTGLILLGLTVFVDLTRPAIENDYWTQQNPAKQFILSVYLIDGLLLLFIIRLAFYTYHFFLSRNQN